MKKCINCGAELPDIAKFCGKCGTKQPAGSPAKVYCLNCGQECEPGTVYCLFCGHNIKTGEPASETEVSAATVVDKDNGTGPVFGFGLDTDMTNSIAELDKETFEKELCAFTYTKNTYGKYVITGLEDRYLRTAKIPEAVEIIADDAFAGSRIISVSLPEGLIEIGAGAFRDCKFLTKINIPQSVQMIGDAAFSGCENLEISIPESVQIRGVNVTEGTKTDRLEKEKAEAERKAREKAEAEKRAEAERIAREKAEAERKTAGDSVIENGVLKKYNGSDAEVMIPSSVTSIGEKAFYWCENLTSVTIPPSVTSIGEEAFCYCKSLTSVTIPWSVKSIGGSAFCYCNSLTSVTIPSSVTSIGEGVFGGCYRLERINVDTNNRGYCDINGILFTKDRKTLIQYPAGKKDSSYTIPSSVTSIGRWAFNFCESLTSVTIPPSVTSIGSFAFSDCESLTSVVIPPSVMSIEYDTFKYCENLTSVTIPSSVTSIGEEAFSGCKSLTSIAIPSSVTNIEAQAFWLCDSLEKICVDPNNAKYRDINGVVFTKSGKTLVIYPPGKNNSSYTIPSSVNIIRECAFQGCDYLERVEIPSSVTSIGDSAFKFCDSLESITVPRSAEIDEDAFDEDCKIYYK